jgi:hypothetical protein
MTRPYKPGLVDYLSAALEAGFEDGLHAVAWAGFEQALDVAGDTLLIAQGENVVTLA